MVVRKELNERVSYFIVPLSENTAMVNDTIRDYVSSMDCRIMNLNKKTEKYLRQTYNGLIDKIEYNRELEKIIIVINEASPAMETMEEEEVSIFNFRKPIMKPTYKEVIEKRNRN